VWALSATLLATVALAMWPTLSVGQYYYNSGIRVPWQRAQMVKKFGCGPVCYAKGCREPTTNVMQIQQLFHGPNSPPVPPLQTPDARNGPVLKQACYVSIGLCDAHREPIQAMGSMTVGVVATLGMGAPESGVAPAPAPAARPAESEANSAPAAEVNKRVNVVAANLTHGTSHRRAPI
jgi:hypothetical protein